jgi:hypothetical protein
MKNILVTVLIAGALALAIAVACMPIFPKTVFTFERHPDFPRTTYLSGKLGVFQPSYARSYLVIAYRYLQGPALTADEQQQVREYWKDRESGDWDKTAIYWMERWEAARETVPGAAPPTKSAVTRGRYAFNPQTNAFVLNCAEDAYNTAVQTLRDRGARFGLRSAALRSWRDAQDMVFQSCDATAAVIPPAATPDLPELIRADREYQIAAAHFYANHYVEAEARFRRIAGDGQSPWQWIAPYLVVRTLARAADAEEGRTADAEKAARELLASKTYSRLHGMTTVLLHRVILKQRDEAYFHALAQNLAGGGSVRGWREELWDYTTLYDKFIGYDPWDRWNPEPKKVAPEIFYRDDLSDWIFTFQQRDPKAYDHALERWRRTHSRPWLIAGLRHADWTRRGVNELIAAAADVKPSDPGFEAIAYYRLALLIDSGYKSEAREELDRILSLDMPKSSVNLFRGLRMRTAGNLTGFLTFAARRPVMLTTDWNEGERPRWGQNERWERGMVAPAAGKDLLDRDSIKVLNERTPMRLLRQAALSGSVPGYHEPDFVLSVFTRAVLLDDVEDGVPLAQRLGAMGADRSGYLTPYLSAAEPEARRFAAIFYLLHHPEARPYIASGMGRLTRAGRIDDYRDNWWCPVDIQVELDARTNMSQYSGPLPERQDPDAPRWGVAFLSADDRKEAAQEMKRLAATGSGPDFFLAETMRWAKAHPSDPRVPEALRWALRSQRYGCVTRHTAAAAEMAGKYLWRRYPKNPWTRLSYYPFESENLPAPYRPR